MPPPAVRDALREQIAALARRYRTPRFEPHITLLGAIAGEIEAIRVHAAALARAIAPIEVRLCTLEHTDAYFRCVYLKAEINEALRSAHRLTCQQLQRPMDEEFMPHLSLVYGDLDAVTRSQLVDDIGRSLATHFTLRELALYDYRGSPEQWRCVQAFELGATASA